MLKIYLIILFFSLPAFSQTEINSVAPQFSNEKIDRIPGKMDDQESEKLLKEMAKKAGWFPEIQIRVNHGIVLIEGRTKDQTQLSWLQKTAEKLPTVIAVVNKVEIIQPPLTDMSPFFNELKNITNIVKKNLPRVVIGFVMAAFFIYLGYKILEVLKSFWARRIPNIFFASTISRLMMIPVWLAFFYLCLMTIGLQSLAGTIIGGTGVLGIVLGFAFKGIAENYLSGLLLAMRSPFTKGDAIKINEFEGIVQNLNMRGTTLLDFDGNLVLIPNITVIQSVVKNMSINKTKRSTFTIGVGFASSIKKCQDLILEALNGTKGVCMEPKPLIFVENMGSSTLNIKVFFWFNSVESSEANLKSSALVKTKELFLANGIQIPDTAREIVMVDPLKVQMLSDFREAQAYQERKTKSLQNQATENFQEVHDLNTQDEGHEEELRKIAEQVALPTQSTNDSLLQEH